MEFVETQEIGQVRHRRINIEEVTGTSYTGRNSLCLASYAECIIIVRRHLKNSDSGYIKDLPTDWKRNQ